MKTFLVAVVVAVALVLTTVSASVDKASRGHGKWLTSLANTTDRAVAVDYTCTAQGNYPDPESCDHYIACTTALIAYRMPCAWMGPGPEDRTHYVPDSGPSEETSYCDWPENVDCIIGVTPGPTTAETVIDTTEHTEDTTLPEDNGECKPCGKPGDICDPTVDCHQCGWCDGYVRCDNDTSQWVKEDCDVQPDEDGTVHIARKLFWNKCSNDHGGTCDFWTSLPVDLREEYENDPTCKLVCAYWNNEKCHRGYFYRENPSGIWNAKEKALNCPADTKWSQNDLTCKLCNSGEDCTSTCT